MLKKSLKYLSIVFVNLLVLTILLAIWTDAFEVTFNSWIRPLEFLKLLGISILGLIVIRIAVSIFRKKRLYDIKKRLRISAYLILAISSYFYVYYAIQIVDHKIINADMRTSVMSKYKSFDTYPYGGTAINLTIEEYTEISKTKWFPKLPETAENIDYSYTYDGFLPDYTFSVAYDLPKHTKVDTLNYKDGTFSQTRTFEWIGEKKRVTYTEYLW